MAGGGGDGVRQEVHQKIWELRQSQTCKQQVTHQM